MQLPSLNNAIQRVNRLRVRNFPNADAIFLAGSTVRGEATATSDLDIIVVYQQLTHAYRSTFRFEGQLVELFVHDMATLRYFMAKDSERGRPSMAHMLSEAVVISEVPNFAATIQQYAQAELVKGPAPLTQAQIDSTRYAISDAVDDLRGARTRHEAIATAAGLYERVANFYLRSQGQWAATGKSIPRMLRQYDANFAERYQTAFQDFFEQGKDDRVVALCAQVLEPFGGFLLEDYRIDAPIDWRIDDALLSGK